MAAPGSGVYQAFALAGAHGIVNAHAGEVSGLYVTNANAAIRYFQLWDRATDVAGGEVGTNTTGAYPPTGLTVISFLVPAGTATAPAVLELGENLIGEDSPLRFQSGIVWAFSSAAQTCTLGTAADHSVTVRWRAA